jgi:hypothetical protein
MERLRESHPGAMCIHEACAALPDQRRALARAAGRCVSVPSRPESPLVRFPAMRWSSMFETNPAADASCLRGRF